MPVGTATYQQTDGTRPITDNIKRFPLKTFSPTMPNYDTIIPVNGKEYRLGDVVDDVNGSADIFYREVVKEHGNKISLIGYRIAGREFSKQVLFETLSNVHRGLKEFHGNSKFTTWLYRIATNAAFGIRRSNKRQPDSMPIDMLEDQGYQLIDEKAEQADEYLARKEGETRINRTLAKMTEKQRVVVELHAYEGFTIKEIACLLKIPVGTVKSRLFYGREEFKNLWIGRYGHVPVTGSNGSKYEYDDKILEKHVDKLVDALVEQLESQILEKETMESLLERFRLEKLVDNLVDTLVSQLEGHALQQPEKLATGTKADVLETPVQEAQIPEIPSHAETKNTDQQEKINPNWWEITPAQRVDALQRWVDGKFDGDLFSFSSSQYTWHVGRDKEFRETWYRGYKLRSIIPRDLATLRRRVYENLF